MNKWYATITNKGSAHEQGLIIEEETGNAIAVSYKAENAKLLAAAPELAQTLQDTIFTLAMYIGHNGEDMNKSETLRKAKNLLQELGIL